MRESAVTTIHDCVVKDLPREYDERGSLTYVYGSEHVDFPIARTYYLYDVPGGATRGGHAHKQLQQLIVSVMGAFDVILYDGTDRKTIRLERAHYGLYIPSMIWRDIVNFSSGAICLAVASLPYAEDDYIRSIDEFSRLKASARAER